MEAAAEAAAGGGAAIAGVLAAAITIFVYFRNDKPAVVPSSLEPRVYDFAAFQKAVVEEVFVEVPGFTKAVLKAGDLFVQPQPVGCKPSRPSGDGLYEGLVDLAPRGGVKKCILLDLGDVVPAGAGAAAAGGGGGGGGGALAGTKRPLAELEADLDGLLAEQKRQKAKSKAFSDVTMGELPDIYEFYNVKEGLPLQLPPEVVADAAVLGPSLSRSGLPYGWKADDSEDRLTPAFLDILTQLTEHTVADCRKVQMSPVPTAKFTYKGCADGLVLHKGFKRSSTFLYEHASAVIEFKEPVAFKTPSSHVPQSLLEMLSSGLPVFTTDMSTGFKAWELQGKTFHPYFGDEILTLAEGIALLRYVASREDAAAAQPASAAAGAGGSSSHAGPGGAAGGGPGFSGGAAGGDGGGSGGFPRESGWQPSGATPEAGAGGGRQQRLGSVETEACSLGDDVEQPPTDYAQYKFRKLMFATVLRYKGVEVPQEDLAQLQ